MFCEHDRPIFDPFELIFSGMWFSFRSGQVMKMSCGTSDTMFQNLASYRRSREKKCPFFSISFSVTLPSPLFTTL